MFNCESETVPVEEALEHRFALADAKRAALAELDAYFEVVRESDRLDKLAEVAGAL